MSSSEPESFSPIEAFMVQFEKDKAAERIRPLKEYVAMFPDEMEAVAFAYVRDKLEDDSAAIPLDARDADRLGPYVIERKLGHGGQGDVYLAVDTRLRRRVALKVLRDLGPGSEGTVNRFKREAEMAAKLNHPGICAVHDAGVLSGTPYIAMQYVEGESLAQHISSAKAADMSDISTYCSTGDDELDTIPIDESRSTESTGSTTASGSGPADRAGIMRIVHFIEKVARALHVAHEEGIIHRDIKPGNLMVGTDGNPIILDFGMARSEDLEDENLTRTGDFFGTPVYMSPEQLLAHRVRLDRRTDIYSLGVTLFECLTCTRPFQAATRDGLYQAIQTKDAPDLRKLNYAVPDDLQTVVEKTLEKDRDRRYETALDLAEELRRVREFEPIHARPVTRWLRTKRWAQRNPGIAASLTLAFLFLSSGLVTTFVLMQQKGTALNEKSLALDHFRQMSDVVQVEDLLQRSKHLWPRREGVVPAMDSWLAQARDVNGRLDSHRAAFEELNLKVHALTEEEKLADARKRKETHRELYQFLDGYHQRLRDTEQKIAEAEDADKRKILEQLREELRKKIARMAQDERFSERLTWRFESYDDSLRHKILRQLMKDSAQFEATIAKMEKRRAFAAEVMQKIVTSEEAKALWATCIADVAKNDKYSKAKTLNLALQEGIVPLGRDEDSGLWEFWHPATGDKPVWKGDVLSGSSALESDSSLVLVLLPGGSMPSQARTTGDSSVRIDPFFLSKHEVTQGQWLRMGFKNESRYTGSLLRPVTRVNWKQCRTASLDLGLDLPTELQWEYAYRAGDATGFWIPNDPRRLPPGCNVSDVTHGSADREYPFIKFHHDGYVQDAPVNVLPPNPWGLCGMVGNVSEWCRDWHYKLPVEAKNGTGLRTASDRLFTTRSRRGANFLSVLSQLQPECRSGSKPDAQGYHIGFRPCLNLAR